MKRYMKLNYVNGLNINCQEKELLLEINSEWLMPYAKKVGSLGRIDLSSIRDIQTNYFVDTRLFYIKTMLLIIVFGIIFQTAGIFLGWLLGWCYMEKKGVVQVAFNSNNKPCNLVLSGNKNDIKDFKDLILRRV